MKLYGGDLWLLGAPEQPVGSAAVSREGKMPLIRELLCPEALRAQALESLYKALESRACRGRCIPRWRWTEKGAAEPPAVPGIERK